MSGSASLLVVSKDNIAEHTAVDIATTLPPLGQSSIRLRTKLISLSSNNLSYARHGSLFHWWDAFPVPSNAPPPYNDQEKWGIVPTWGYGEIVETTIGTLKPGTVFYGLWPMSTLPVDLKLEAFELKGHWKEVSSHRESLMSLYNRYYEVEDHLSSDEQKQAWTVSLFPVGQTGILFNRYIFPGAKGAPPMKPQHPLGSGLPWSREDADLSSAILVSLSAASKTGRSLAFQITQNRDWTEHGPLGFLQVTRIPHLLGSSGNGMSDKSDRAVSYEELTSPATLNWIVALKPKRMVIADFGVRVEVIEGLKDAVTSSELFESPPSITLIGIGSEMRVLSTEETQTKMTSGQNLGRIQFNATRMIERRMEAEGSETYFKNLFDDFDRWLNGGASNDLELQWGTGIRGADGVEAIWRALCNGQVLPTKACVLKM